MHALTLPPPGHHDEMLLASGGLVCHRVLAPVGWMGLICIIAARKVFGRSMEVKDL